MAGIKKVRNPGDITQLEHCDAARAKRTVSGGFVIGTNVMGGTGVHADIFTAAVLVGPNKSLLITNRDAAVQYVTFGAVAVGVGTEDNGFAIMPGEQLVVSSGEHYYVRSSDADVHCVEIED